MASLRTARESIACLHEAVCERCAIDQAFLRSTTRPPEIPDAPVLRMVDLFAGCGGMSLGFEEAARRSGFRVEIPLAIDSDSEVLEMYKRNISRNAEVADVNALFDGALGAIPTPSEEKLVATVTPIAVLIGGPPCQGHSDLNNHTRRNDPKNGLYLSMARAAEVLQPDVVVIENVSAVQWDQSRVVQTTVGVLEKCGYDVAARVLNLGTIGVPQRRRRFVLLAARTPVIDPSKILSDLGKAHSSHPPRTVRWAIADLLDVDSGGVFDSPSKKSKDNATRMAYLFERGRYNLPNDQRPKCHRERNHSYISVYGRLRWDRPAQTITTGFGCMGQGRYVHPQRRRTITPHEAARLQTFPDWFDFGKQTRRGVLAKAIGNAVPPLLTVELGRMIITALKEGAKALARPA